MSTRLAEIIASREQEALRSGSPSRSIRLKLNGEDKNLTVISLPSKLVTLNPRNHRITAQIEDGRLLGNYGDPYCEDAQKIIRKLLSETDEYSKLKQELESLGQREPGLITRDGLLINGNTRCAALMDLSESGVVAAENIDVALLPEGTTPLDVLSIELDLQMVKLTHQDYTFTNRLIFMRNALNNNYSEKQLAKKMNWIRRGEAKVQKNMRLLSYITEVREMSNPPISWKIFDMKETHLNDLDDKMQAMKNEGDTGGAEALKYARLLAIFLGLNKDQVREVDHETLSHLGNMNPESSLSNFIKQFEAEIDDDFDDSDSGGIIDTGSILREMMNTPGVLDDNQMINESVLDQNINLLSQELSMETDRRVQQGREKSRDQELSLTVRKIRVDIQDIIEKLPERINNKYFKPSDFKYEVSKAKSALDALLAGYNKLRP
jgi:hypothetical protein